MEAHSYFLKHWRGDLSLPVAYWINAILIGTVVTLILLAGLSAVADWSENLRLQSLAGFFFWPISIGVWIWSVVGVWRSAENRVLAGGGPGWARVAQAMVVLGALSMAGQVVTSTIPQMVEFGKIALGLDPLAKNSIIAASEDGKFIEITGPLGAGAGDRFEEQLRANPDAGQVVLNSNGGRIFEAGKIAAAIRREGLDTYVEGQCVSACTHIFLAGADRAATPNARIGFHQPYFPGLDEAGRQAFIDTERSRYLKEGISESFVERALSTSPDDVWYPTFDELVEAGVINRMSFGGEQNLAFQKLRSKAELESGFQLVPVHRALKVNHPTIYSDMIDAAWAARQNGGSDADIMTAGRKVLMNNLGTILRGASDQTILDYVDLLHSQFSVVRRYGAEACAQYMRGTLNPTGVFTREQSDREIHFLERAIQENAQPSGSGSAEEGARIFQRIALKLPDRQIQAIAAPEDRSKDADRCEGFDRLLGDLVELGREERLAAGRFFVSTQE